MKKIRITSMCLCAAMISAMLAGCGKSEEAGVKTVTVWSGNSHSKMVVSQIVNEFNNTKGKEMNVKIDYIVKEGDSGKAIDLAYETGEEPDFAQTGNVEKLAEDGKIVALNDLPGGMDLLAGYDKSDYENFTFHGKTYKVPYGATTQGLVYNKDMFKKYGIVDENGEAKPPKTLDEVREYAKIMTNPAEQEYGIVIPLGNQWLYGTDVLGVAKASCNTREYDWVEGEFDFSSHLPVLEMYQGIRDDESFLPGADNMDNDTARAQFAQGKIGMKFGASYDVGVYNDQFPAKCDWGVAPYPTAKEGERYKSELSSNGFLVINKKGVERLGEELVVEIFKFFHDDAMMEELYKQGMEIPCKPSIIEKVTLENPKHGWKEFAGLLEYSVVIPWGSPKTIRTGEPSTNDYFLKEFWTGKMTAKQVTDEMTASYNKGMKLWFEQNPDKKPSDYIIADYNTRMD